MSASVKTSRWSGAHPPRNAVGWRPDNKLLARIDRLLGGYRRLVEEELGQLTQAYYPALKERTDNEYRKMVELSTKMTMVGHACSQIADFPFDRHRQVLSVLYGGCCFLADSFLDDFGEAMASEYLDRFEVLLTKGWFPIRNDREKLFYIILSRLFERRDMLDPMLRQAIYSLFLAQKRDVSLRMNAPSFRHLSHRLRLDMLRECARDRSGHAILVLTRLVTPELSLRNHHLLFLAGALIMYIDDHGDCYADRRAGRLTYMNEIRQPATVLTRIYENTMHRLRRGLPENEGKDLLCCFLHRYYLTRMEKHTKEGRIGGLSWAIYE